jgi:hypothetical protein
MTPGQVDRKYRLEWGCCLEACQNGWVKASFNPQTQQYDVDATDAERRWGKETEIGIL